MKKYSFLFILAVAVQLCLPHPSHSEEFNFRKTRWGMSKQEVMASEQSKPKYENNNKIGYEVKVLDKEFLTIYFFYQNKLVKSIYLLKNENPNKNDFIYKYEELKEILTKKYGPPTTDNTIWANDSYKDDRSHWDIAISLGHLSFFSTWETEKTKITNYLTGRNSRIYCFIKYISTKLIHLEEQQEHKKNMESF